MLTPKNNSFLDGNIGTPIGLPVQTPKESSYLVDNHTNCPPNGNCPEPNPRTCCQLMIDHKTQLVPPALIDRTHDVTAIRTVEAVVEKVCPEKVVICGVIHKKITYTPVDACGRPGTHTIDIFDDIPFQCFIDRDDATIGASFRVVGAEVMCVVFERAQNFGKHPENPALTVAWKFVEKDIIKVCIERQETRPKVC